MQIVIDIPEENYQIMLTKLMLNFRGYKITEIPKGHGRLIDADALKTLYGLEYATKYGNKTVEQQDHSYDTMMMYEIADMFDNAPTIIEADKE